MTQIRTLDPMLPPRAPAGTGSAPFQLLPPLPADQLDALRADIRDHGILVPILLDQHGRILDGHHRRQIAHELGIDCPSEVRNVRDDDEAADLALVLNCGRRQLTREQVRELIASELIRRPGDSDRAIARRVGCSPSTVGSVRKGKVSKLDTPAWTAPDDVDIDLRTIVLTNLDGWNLAPDLPKSDAEDQWLRAQMLHDVDRTVPLVLAIAAGAEPIELAVAITGKMALYKSRGMDRRRIHDLFDPWLDIALSPSSRERFRTDPGMVRIVECGEDPEFVESMLSLVASIPDGFRRGAAA